MRPAPFLVLATAIAALLALPVAASADTLYASPGGDDSATTCPADHRCSITNAVQRVARTDDVVEAAPGDYNVAQLTLAKRITLRGEPGAANPRIVGTRRPLSVAFAAAGATIQDVTVDQVGDGIAVTVGGSATIERSLILARGPGAGPADADALYTASSTTVRDTTIRVNRNPAATNHPTVTAGGGVLTLRNVSVTRQDHGSESALGLDTSSGGSPSVDADGLTIEATRALTLGGPGHSVIHDLTATQPPGAGQTVAVVASGTTQIDGAVIESSVDATSRAALITGAATLSNATVDAPDGGGVIVEGDARLDRARVRAQLGVEMFGAATVTNSLVVATGIFAGRYGGPGPTASVRNSTLIAESNGSGFRKDAGGTVELVNTIMSAGTDIELNGGAVAARNSRFATVSGSGLTDDGGNVAAGPRFTDPTVGDYRLQPDSPMVDAGETHDLLGPVDLAGLPRVSGPKPDIGAFEFQHPVAVDPPAPQPPTTVDDLAPPLRSASLRPRRFAAGSKTPRLRFALSEPASVAIAIARERPGRRRGSRCVKPSRKLRRGRRCTRLVAAGTLKADGAAGSNSMSFSGQGLRRGPYRLTLVPTDAAGNRGKPVTVRFVIARA